MRPIDDHFYWIEIYEGHEFQLNSYSMLRQDMAYHRDKLVYTSGPQARAWHAYYAHMRDDPESIPEQRARAADMMQKFPIPDEYKTPLCVEDLA